jgi:hypothetical protein
MIARHIWTAAESAYLRQRYPDESTQAIAKRLKQPIRKVYAKASMLGLTKTETYLRDPKNRCGMSKGSLLGEATRFPKGHVPANKGLRSPGCFRGRMRETWFSKGNRSGVAARNWKPVGTILRDTEGYLRIKVREAVHGKEATGFGNVRVWPLLQRHVWEQHHGPIPPRHVIAFRNRDRADCAIRNLECISRADLARRNRMWGRLPDELAQAIQLNGALKRKLRRLNDAKQND